MNFMSQLTSLEIVMALEYEIRGKYVDIFTIFTKLQSYNESGNMDDKQMDDKMECLNIDNKDDEGTMINDNDKGDIKVTEMDGSNSELNKKDNVKMLVVRAKNKSYKQKFIRRLMLYGLKPNLKIASMKNAFCKKKISVVNIRKRIEGL